MLFVTPVMLLGSSKLDPKLELNTLEPKPDPNPEAAPKPVPKPEKKGSLKWPNPPPP